MTLWKSVERKIAGFLGGVRVPITGRQRGSAPDIEHPRWSIEVKERQTLPDWLLDAMAQADAANNGDKISVAILHKKGNVFQNDLVVMRLKDLKEIQDRFEDMKGLIYYWREKAGVK